MGLKVKITKRKQKMMALRASIAVSMSAFVLFAPNSAMAQTTSDTKGEQTENQPVTAGQERVLALESDLPKDLRPEELTVAHPQTLNPTGKRVHSKNSWNLDTLTHSARANVPTGLSASSYSHNTKPTTQSHNESDSAATMRAIDLLSTTDLLEGTDLFAEKKPSLQLGDDQQGVFNLNTPLRGSLFDLPIQENVNTSAFRLNEGKRLCLGTTDDCSENNVQQIGVGFAKNITHGKLNGFNVQLSPRAGIRFDEESKSALVGALLRIGDNLRDGPDMKSNTWYLFAGADAEAVTYTPNSIRGLASGEFRLQDRILVGDAQAGLGYKFGTADLALTYFRRQATAENYKYDENAAALSITWKR